MTTKKTKTFTIDEVDKMTLNAERLGFVNGMATCYELLDEVLRKLQNSVEDVQAIYYIGNVVTKKAQQVSELQVAFDTLTQLRDMMSDAYFTKLEEHNSPAHKEEYEELRESLGL